MELFSLLSGLLSIGSGWIMLEMDAIDNLSFVMKVFSFFPLGQSCPQAPALTQGIKEPNGNKLIWLGTRILTQLSLDLSGSLRASYGSTYIPKYLLYVSDKKIIACLEWFWTVLWYLLRVPSCSTKFVLDLYLIWHYSRKRDNLKKKKIRL